MATMSMRFKSGDDEISFSEPNTGSMSRIIELRTVYQQHSVVTRTIILSEVDIKNLVEFLKAAPINDNVASAKKK